MTAAVVTSINLSYWALQTLAMMTTALLIPRLRITGIFGALFTVIALALVNAKIWDAALFFQIPNSFSMHAGLLLISNGVIFWILVKILPGIEINGFFPALLAPIVFTVCSLLIDQYAQYIDWKMIYETCRDVFQTVRAYFLSTSPAGASPDSVIPPG